jgi:hypothetical protein
MVYAQVGLPSLFFFADIPSEEVSEEDYEELSAGFAEKDEWVCVGQVTEANEGRRWYPVQYVDPESGSLSHFWTPASLGGQPSFSLFSAYPM